MTKIAVYRLFITGRRIASPPTVLYKGNQQICDVPQIESFTVRAYLKATPILGLRKEIVQRKDKENKILCCLTLYNLFLSVHNPTKIKMVLCGINQNMRSGYNEPSISSDYIFVIPFVIREIETPHGSSLHHLCS